MDKTWRAVGASVIGVSHRRNGQPCQDAFVCKELANGAIIAAVADGAGSARYGGLGAQIAVQTAGHFLAAKLMQALPPNYPQWSALLHELLDNIQGEIALSAQAESATPRDFAATLLITIVGSKEIVCASLGDCAVVVRDEQERLSSLCPPQRGEYANATYFVTHGNAHHHLSVRMWKSHPQNVITHLALMTDGLLELALNVGQNRPFEPFFQPLFAFIDDVGVDSTESAASDLSTFLDSDRVNSRTHDDKTLLLLRRAA